MIDKKFGRIAYFAGELGMAEDIFELDAACVHAMKMVISDGEVSSDVKLEWLRNLNDAYEMCIDANGWMIASD